MDNSTVITITARKGGVGKTALASTLASLMAASGRTVLLVDMDAQSSAAMTLGVDPFTRGTANWLEGTEAHFQEVQPGLQLLAGGPGLDRIHRLEPTTLARNIRDCDAEVVIIDTAPGATSISRAALGIADIVLVATEPHPLGLSGAASILAGLSPEQKRAVVLSRLDLRKSLHRSIREGASEAFGLDVLQVRHDARLERALAEGRPAALGKKTKAIEDVAEVLAWITAEEGESRAEA